MGKGRAPCCDKNQVKRGPWSPAEDLRLITFIQTHGHDNWRALPKQAGTSTYSLSLSLHYIIISLFPLLIFASADHPHRPPRRRELISPSPSPLPTPTVSFIHYFCIWVSLILDNIINPNEFDSYY